MDLFALRGRSADALRILHADQRGLDSAARTKQLVAWTPDTIRQAGFTVELFSQAGIAYHGDHLSLRLDPGARPGYSAARITESPSGHQTRPWQPTPTHAIVSTFTVRWLHPRAEAGMTHNLILWNANKHHVTAFGVSQALDGTYRAVTVQDFDSATFSGALFALKPMPVWLNATQWHEIELYVAVDQVTIAVRQEGQEAVLIDVALQHPPDELGFEFSVDNETRPNVYAPVRRVEQVDIAAFTIGLLGASGRRFTTLPKYFTKSAPYAGAAAQSLLADSPPGGCL